MALDCIIHVPEVVFGLQLLYCLDVTKVVLVWDAFYFKRASVRRDYLPWPIKYWQNWIAECHVLLEF